LTFHNFIGAAAAAATAVTERTTPLQLTKANGIYVICLIDLIPWRRFYFYITKMRMNDKMASSK
jgi:hypothetical protein